MYWQNDFHRSVWRPVAHSEDINTQVNAAQFTVSSCLYTQQKEVVDKGIRGWGIRVQRWEK